ncbi:hypothetical protein AB0M34_11330 [Nocardia sp. NPDC050193]
MQDLTREIRGIVDRLLAVPGTFTRAKVAESCSAQLIEIASPDPNVHEFEAHIRRGPFSTLMFREHAAPTRSPGALVAMEVASNTHLAIADLSSCFELSLEFFDVNPHIPPEGALSFQESAGSRLVILEFGALSGLLLSVAVHETHREHGQHNP